MTLRVSRETFTTKRKNPRGDAEGSSRHHRRARRSTARDDGLSIRALNQGAIWPQASHPCVIANRTRPARLKISSFSITCALCDSTVFTLIPSFEAISLFV
jgi:hypothetical protein